MVAKIVSKERAPWKAFAIELMGKVLQRRGLVKRAPNFALIEVTDATREAFTTSLPNLTDDFDYVVVLRCATTEEPNLPKKFKVVGFSEQFQTRWSLLQHCANGFVFPLRAGDTRSLDQQRELKAQLFAHGGNCIAGYANLKQFLNPDTPLAADFSGPILLSSLDVNQVVFDQRFLKIRPSELAPATETQDLADLAQRRQAPLLAIDAGELAASHRERKGFAWNEEVAPRQSRSELIESLVRLPNLSKQMNVRRARLWNDIWLGLDYSPVSEISADRIDAFAANLTTSEPSNADLRKARVVLETIGAAK